MLVFGKVRQFGFLGAVTHGRPQRVDQSHREMIAGSSAGNRSSRPRPVTEDPEMAAWKQTLIP